MRKEIAERVGVTEHIVSVSFCLFFGFGFRFWWLWGLMIWNVIVVQVWELPQGGEEWSVALRGETQACLRFSCFLGCICEFGCLAVREIWATGRGWVARFGPWFVVSYTVVIWHWTGCFETLTGIVFCAIESSNENIVLGACYLGLDIYNLLLSHPKNISLQQTGSRLKKHMMKYVR